MSLFVLLATVAGCTAQQVAKVDKALADANAVGSSLRDAVEGPAGDLVPVPIGSILVTAAIVAQAALLWWRQNKYKLLKTSAGAVVQAVETLPPEAANDVKGAVALQMNTIAAQTPTLTYAKLNTVIDSLKV
jgi:hypothetical protein